MDKENDNLEFDIPVLPLRGLVIFPDSVLHLDVVRNSTLNAILKAMDGQKYVFITTQKEIIEDDPKPEDLYEIGVYSKIMQIIKMTETLYRIIIKGVSRAYTLKIVEQSGYYIADLGLIESKPAPDSIRIEAIINLVRQCMHEYGVINSRLPDDILSKTFDIKQPGRLADFIADNIIRDCQQKQKILETINEEERITSIIHMLNHEISVLKIEIELSEKTKEKIDDSQREFYLRERMKAIQEELGEKESFESEIFEYEEKIHCLKTTDENIKKLLKEVRKLEKMPSASPEANVVRNYLDTCIELPWGVYTKDKLNVCRIRTLLDKNHYGLKKVKDSIVETLAVRKLNPETNGQIICLAGPPGVGKTSIAASIADAIGRKYQRVALGGIHDEAEIRGHRRTYIGAMMGRIMYAINQAGSSNPLILLDEVDKIGNDYRGDPTSALLEVLDGEQNSNFFDHYIDLPFDLSKVMFITTANDYTSIPEPLLDRMEIIHIESYTREEKFLIAKKHIIIKQLKKHGLTLRNFKISDDSIYELIDSYTREAGVRSLERCISKLMNKAAVKIVSEETKTVKITKNCLEDYLGAKKYKLQNLKENNEVGLVTGLAWTSVGGETLQVEVAIMDGTGKIELTGSLGDVMKESAYTAFTCVRTMISKLNIQPDFYKTKDIHIHVPEGAVPKDGPSAGITMATAITSALTGIPVRSDIAMTGEITIRGKVLPIGGLKEKAMAAYRFGIKKIIIPKDNISDLDELDDVIKSNVEFICTDNIQTVLDNALIKK